jgi:16S rRNA U1498 N3-methylase RsmE
MRKRFRDFVDDELKARLGERPGLLADTSGSLPFPRRVSPPHTLILGPEGGLLGDEIAAFREAGVVVASLGRRLLKVEVAVAVCLSRCL